MLEIDRSFPDPTILLHPQIPKPLHTLNPRNILGDEWWDLERTYAYRKHDFHCHACGMPASGDKYRQWLEAHEMYKIDYKTGAVVFTDIVALCYCCHNFIHKGRMKALLGTEFTQAKYDYIIKRGNKILKLNQLKAKEQIATCKWKDWHLVIDGRNYGQRFKNIEEWKRYYHIED